MSHPLCPLKNPSIKHLHPGGLGNVLSGFVTADTAVGASPLRSPLISLAEATAGDISLGKPGTKLRGGGGFSVFLRRK